MRYFQNQNLQRLIRHTIQLNALCGGHVSTSVGI